MTGSDTCSRASCQHERGYHTPCSQCGCPEFLQQPDDDDRGAEAQDTGAADEAAAEAQPVAQDTPPAPVVLAPDGSVVPPEDDSEPEPEVQPVAKQPRARRATKGR